jgi:hypothetical protein
MLIDLKLFAHIENDAHLSGTFGLEGNSYRVTMAYFEHFLDLLTKASQNQPLEGCSQESKAYLVACKATSPKEYEQITADMQLAIEVEERLSQIKPSEHSKQMELAVELQKRILNLKVGERCTLPGGWTNQTGGHALLYQFQVKEEGKIRFVVINSGAGLNYHFLKSKSKILYNPLKAWDFPKPSSDKTLNEFAIYLKTLLEIQIHDPKRKTVDADDLYALILPKISHFNGVEQDLSPELKEYFYTGGQLSGTCSQRSLHQLLKLAARSEREFHRFIFHFKTFALFEFIEHCRQNPLSRTEEAQRQIELAITNNLKILNIKGAFSKEEITQYMKQIAQAQSDLNTIVFLKPSYQRAMLLAPEPFLAPGITLFQWLWNFEFEPFRIHQSTKSQPSALSLRNDKPLATQLDEFYKQLIKEPMQLMVNEFVAYQALEELITSLPFDTNLPLYEDPAVQKSVAKIRALFELVKSKCLPDAHQTPSSNILSLSLLHLEMELEEQSRQRKAIPSFRPVIKFQMHTILYSSKHNPYWASGDPRLDARLAELNLFYEERLSESRCISDYMKFFEELLSIHPQEVLELKAFYAQRNQNNSSQEHSEILKKELGALMVLADALKGKVRLDELPGDPIKLQELLARVKDQLAYEEQLLVALTPFTNVTVESGTNSLEGIFNSYGDFSLKSLFQKTLNDAQSSPTLMTDKYNVPDSAAADALKKDFKLPFSRGMAGVGSLADKLPSSSDNAIQLRGLHKTDGLVSAEDICCRDYFHLRGTASIQIALTLDYFGRHLSKLDNKANQLYVEANLFEPGLLLKALEEPEHFLIQLDKFIAKGERYFSVSGKQNVNSVFFTRLNHKVLSYLAKMPRANKALVQQRLLSAVEVIKEHIQCTEEPRALYVLHELMFLNLMLLKDETWEEPQSLNQAMRSYFYLQSHTDPKIWDDTAVGMHKQVVFACFKNFLQTKSDFYLEHLVHDLFPDAQGFYPNCTRINPKTQARVHINLLLGKEFQGPWARFEIPFELAINPLIKHLGLDSEKECLVAENGKEFLLGVAPHQVYVELFDGVLTLSKKWTIENKVESYLIQPLNVNHPAHLVNNKLKPITTGQLLFQDGSLDYWSSKEFINGVFFAKGIFTKNQVPLYLCDWSGTYELDEKGERTGYQVKKLQTSEMAVLSQFEDPNFILALEGEDDVVYQLPRYTLRFIKSDNEPMRLFETQEEVLENPQEYLNPKLAYGIANLVLKNEKGDTRCLVPVQRFYAAVPDTSGMHKAVHDTGNRIAQSCLADLTSVPKIWHYDKAETLCSFSLKEGEPTADNVSDALYLAYLYLATDQPQKAWHTLSLCSNELGGLTGDLRELTYIIWIRTATLHHPPGEKAPKAANKPERNTPPYVACQLKAMALLTTYFAKDKRFELKKPLTELKTANQAYQMVQQGATQCFIDEFQAFLNLQYERYLTMDRYLEDTYRLSDDELKSLGTHYVQVKGAIGAIGREWVALHRKLLLEEAQAIQSHLEAGQKLSKTEQDRLDLILERLQSTPKERPYTTELALVPIDLSIPDEMRTLEPQAKVVFNEQIKTWTGQHSDKEIESALSALSLGASDTLFAQSFSALVQLAASTHADAKTQAMQEQLSDFCKKTLIANSMLDAERQNSYIPYLCNLLYRVMENKKLFKDFLSKDLKTWEELIRLADKVKPPQLKAVQQTIQHAPILPTDKEHINWLADPQKPIVLSVPKVTQTALMEQTGLKSRLSKMAQRALDHFVERYKKHLDEHEQRMQALKKDLETTKYTEFINLETKAGNSLLLLQKECNELAKELLDTDLPKLLAAEAQTASLSVRKAAQTAWNKALNLARIGPEEEERAFAWFVELKTKVRAQLEKTSLLRLYSKAEASFSIRLTGLSLEQVKQLHELIHAALVLDIHEQALLEISSRMQKALQSQNAYAAVDALDVLSRSELLGLDEPALVLIQHQGRILLRAQQEQAIKRLLEPGQQGKPYQHRVEKIIMGGGKSKVILPILVERKAKGNNLVVIEVPLALLKTNYVDLNRTSYRLYGKRAFCFEFSRESKCTPERLEQVYNELNEVMTKRNYLVTTGEAVQSVELKYLELLLEHTEQDNTWEKQVYWLDKITNLFRHNADALIDEVHQGLSVKKKLNYTLGQPKPLSSKLIEHSIELFKRVDQELLEKAPYLPVDYNWDSFKNKLAKELVESKNGPLAAFMRLALKKSPDATEQIIAYLTQKASVVPVVIEEANPEQKNTLAFFKAQISEVLVETLCRPLNTKYGASALEGLDPVERTLAIPYSANNVPNERNRLGLELEAINCTIQMMRLKGISKELLIQYLTEEQAAAGQELLQNTELSHFRETSVAKDFKRSTGLELGELHLSNEEQCTQIHQKLANNELIMAEVLKRKSLKQIKIDSTILHSDAFNHVDVYRTLQGLSGTPSNYTTFHHALEYKQSTSLGTDGFVMGLIQDKDTKVRSCDFTNLTDFLQQTLSTSKELERCRAIIDINATFNGVSNTEVSKELALYFNPKHKGQPQSPQGIEHILFFDEQDVLCARSTKNPEQIIVLGTSDKEEINNILGTQPVERFTYFDQVHTLGIDLAQASNAHAMVLMDEKGSLPNFLQGCMRMRELAQNQTLELIVPSRIKDHSLSSIIAQLIENEQKDLFQDNLLAAKANMTNCIRRSLLSLIQSLGPKEQVLKSTLARAFKTFLVESSSLNFFELYGGVAGEQSAESILKNMQKELIARWKNAFTALYSQNPELQGVYSITEEDEALMEERLGAVIQKALPFLLPTYKDSTNQASLEVQNQKQIQNQIQVEQRVQTLKQTHPKNLYPMRLFRWADRKFLDLESLFVEGNPKTKRLNELCAIDKNTQCPTLFSDQLRVSDDYRCTYSSRQDDAFNGNYSKDQETYLDVFLKPALLIWFYLDTKDVLHAMIITPQEVDPVCQFIDQCTRPTWISTVSDTPIYGNSLPYLLERRDYKLLKEQVAFFNGECFALLDSPTPLIWLNEGTDEKLDFLEKHILPIRPLDRERFQELKTSFTSDAKLAGYDYIQSRSTEDLTEVDWLTLFPKATPTQIKKYESLAQALLFINTQWITNFRTLDSIRRTFQLAPESFRLVSEHFERSVKRLDERQIEDFLDKGLKLQAEQLRTLANNTQSVPLILKLVNSHALLHLCIELPKTLSRILNLIPESKRLDAIKSEDELGNTLLHSAAAHGESLQVLLKYIPEGELVDWLKLQNKAGNTALLHAANDPSVLTELLSGIPQEQRLEVVSVPNTSKTTLIHGILPNENALHAVFRLIPEDKRLSLLRIKSLMDYAVKLPKSLICLVNLLPEHQRLEALMIKLEEMDETVLFTLIEETDTLTELFKTSIPKEDHLKALMSKTQDDTPLLCKAVYAPKTLELLLSLCPDDQRLSLIKTADACGQNALHFASNYPESLELLLSVYPEEERMAAILEEGAEFDSVFSDSGTEALLVLLRLIPEKFRIDFLKSNRGAESVCDALEAEVCTLDNSFAPVYIGLHHLLEQYTEEDTSGNSAAFFAPPKAPSIIADFQNAKTFEEVKAVVVRFLSDERNKSLPMSKELWDLLGPDLGEDIDALRSKWGMPGYDEPLTLG